MAFLLSSNSKIRSKQKIVEKLSKHLDDGTFPPDISCKSSLYTMYPQSMPDTLKAASKLSQEAAFKNYAEFLLRDRLEVYQEDFRLFKESFQPPVLHNTMAAELRTTCPFLGEDLQKINFIVERLCADADITIQSRQQHSSTSDAESAKLKSNSASAMDVGTSQLDLVLQQLTSVSSRLNKMDQQLKNLHSSGSKTQSRAVRPTEFDHTTVRSSSPKKTGHGRSSNRSPSPSPSIRQGNGLRRGIPSTEGFRTIHDAPVKSASHRSSKSQPSATTNATVQPKVGFKKYQHPRGEDFEEGRSYHSPTARHHRQQRQSASHVPARR